MNENSNFWIEENEDLNDLREKDNLKFLMRLSSYKNSINNFVEIMTKRSDIKVKFNAENKSFTDGKVVVIGSDMSDGNIDVSVGIALHESMHIVETDMNYFKTFWSKIPNKLNKLAKDKNYKPNEIADLSTDILNYVEDRYIDHIAFRDYPGYRGYYEKMYEKYWNSQRVSDGLRSCFFRTKNIESYKFRIINLTNKSTDLNALSGLKEIYDLIDFKNIERLDTQEKRGKLSIDIMEILINNLGENQELDYIDKIENEQLEEKSGSGQPEPTVNDEKSDDKKEKDSNTNESVPTDLSDLLKEQMDFLKGSTSKSTLTENESLILENLEKSETSISPSGGTDGIPMIPCVVIKKMTRDTINAGIIPMSMKSSPSEESVKKGILMGTVLGKKLQIRGESRTTKFNRLKRGKIDKRLLSGLGYNNENVFFNTSVDEYKKVFVHLTVDSSQSMRSDEKWDKVMTCVVAICKAASMIQNIHVMVTFRSTSNKSSGANLPYIVVAYDSRFDKFSKIVQLFPSLCPNGATPEGLTFQTMTNLIPKSTTEQDSYFINFSDGEPYFPYGTYKYQGPSAAKHTKRQVDKIKSNNVDVLSYFVGDNSDTPEMFKFMYGINSKIVDVTDVTTIAKTLNEKFLEKNSS